VCAELAPCSDRAGLVTPETAGCFSALRNVVIGPEPPRRPSPLRVRCWGRSCRASHCASRQLMTHSVTSMPAIAALRKIAAVAGFGGAESSALAGKSILKTQFFTCFLYGLCLQVAT
jgi:hypothetical protein